MSEVIMKIITESWVVLGLMSPYLLFGFLIAGILSVLISPKWIEKHLGGKGFWQIFKASAFGVPLPLCSCGVIPVSASLRKSGASKGATVSFLLSTPQTGVDAVMITYGLLGGVFAVLRPIVALITGLIGGLFVTLFDSDEQEDIGENEHSHHDHSHENSCCSEDHSLNHEETCCSEKKSCCKALEILKYGFITLPQDIGLALIFGVFIAGAMSALIPANSLNDYIENDVLSILAMIVVGMPLYVCATSSVPIAAGFIMMGISPGAALAFLITGPETNAATVTTLWKILGKKTTLIYMGTVVLSAVLSGLLLNLILADSYILPMAMSHHHEELAKGFYDISAVALLLVLAFSYTSKYMNNSKKQEQSCCSTEEEHDKIAEKSCCNHSKM